MNIKECFQKFGGDYEGAVSRLGREERVIRHTKMFTEGDDYQLIESSIYAGNKEEAFRNVHNVKGVALNLGLTPLYQTADVLCEAFRPGNPPVSDEEIKGRLTAFKAAYDNLLASMAELG